MDSVFNLFESNMFLYKKTEIIFRSLGCWLVWGAMAVTGIKAQQSSHEMDLFFEDYKKNFLDTYWFLNPQAASEQGMTAYDTTLYMPTMQQLQQSANYYKSIAEDLHTFRPEQLSAALRMDYQVMENALNKQLFYIETLKEQEWNPDYYNPTEAFTVILNSNAPDDEKLYKINHKIEKLTEYFKIPRENIKTPTLAHAQWANTRTEVLKSIFYHDIPDLLQRYRQAGGQVFFRVDIPTFEKRLEKAQLAVQSFMLYLKNDALPRAELTPFPKSFRLGEQLYKEKFALELNTRYTPEELYSRALDEKDAIHQRVIGLTAQLWAKYLPDTVLEYTLVHSRQLLDILAQQHSSPTQLTADLQQNITQLQNFTQQRNLFNIGKTAQPVEIRPMPASLYPMADLAFLWRSGVYSPQAEAFYYVKPLQEMPAAAENILRNYNHFAIQLLNIHETIPGYYTKNLYEQEHKDLINQVFASPTTHQGWANYAERMMLEEGYGNQSPELWLNYYKRNLGIVCNVLIDYGVHVLDWNEEEAIMLLTQEAFQEEAQARRQWQQAQHNAVQLATAYAGLSEIYELREEIKSILGADFKLKDFHEQFLGYGSLPVKNIRELMLNGE